MTTSEFKPMLSGKFDLDSPERFEKQLRGLTYPLYASPKIDGIRVGCHPTLGAVTRSLKPVKNKFVRKYLSHPHLAYLDGEVVVGDAFKHSTQFNDDPGVFNRTTAIMAESGEPDFRYLVFDHFMQPGAPFSDRAKFIAAIVMPLLARTTEFSRVEVLPQMLLESPEGVLDYEERCLENGYEGVMLRHPSGIYKFGRSTLREQHLVKLKRTEDDEATIVGVVQRLENQNEQFRDELGYAKRSAHQENKVPLPMLGAFICKSEKFNETFNVGSGFDHASAERWWEIRDKLIGKRITYKYQECGTIDKPRHPIFLRFREPE